jgi:hypothetical protein
MRKYWTPKIIFWQLLTTLALIVAGQLIANHIGYALVVSFLSGVPMHELKRAVVEANA